MARKREVESYLTECQEKYALVKQKLSEANDANKRLSDALTREKELRRLDYETISFESALYACKAQVDAEITVSADKPARQWSLVILRKALAGL